MCTELTKEELQSTNGCGSGHWALRVFRIPTWISKAFARCCNRHDLRYKNLEDKDRADDELYDCWYYNAWHSPWYQKVWKIRLAELGYWCIKSEMSNLSYGRHKEE